MTEITFERPDYCKGCNLKAYDIETTVFSDGDGNIVAVNNTLICAHDEICKMWQERPKEKLESEDEE